MSGRQQLHIVLDLEEGADPLRGTLESDDRVRTFWGWLQLIQTIEDAIASHAVSESEEQNAAEPDPQSNPPPREDPDEHQDACSDRARDR